MSNHLFKPYLLPTAVLSFIIPPMSYPASLILADLAAIHERLGRDFGPLDNTASKWVGKGAALQAAFPEIEAMLAAHFGAAGWALETFRDAATQYRALAAGLQATDLEAETRDLCRGYLSLRFYIGLAAFLDAVSDALAKRALDPGADAEAAVRGDALAPYFFARTHLSYEELVTILEGNLAELAALPGDKSTALKAKRIRNGLFSVLSEEYCPTHPALYPYAEAIKAIEFKADGEAAKELTLVLDKLLARLRKD